MENIIESFNIFIDTSRGDDTTNNDSQGDCYTLRLNDVNIDSAVGQYIRLTVTNFSMYKNFTNINSNNSRFTLRTNAQTRHLDLDHKNYDKIRDIGQNFADKIGTQLVADTGGAVSYDVSGLTPIAAAGIAGTTNNVITFDIILKDVGTNPINHSTITSCLVQFYEKSPDDNKDSDVFDILGGDRISDNTDTTTNSITTDIQAGYIRFTCLYPAQRYSESHVYLATNIPSKHLATSSINAGNTNDDKNTVHHTTIIGKFGIDTEIINYDAPIDKQYFVDITHHHLTNIRLIIQDHHGRRLPQFGTNQNKLGNMNFNCVLRCDIIQKFKPDNQRISKPEKQNFPLRDNNLMINPTGINRYYKGL